MDRRQQILAFLLPLIVLLPKITVALPGGKHAARQVAGYFQTLALLRTGLESYAFLTPEESLSALHLHSVLSAPFVGLGYVEGGRLVSWLAAVAAVVLVAFVARELIDDRAMLIAPVLLLLHPTFRVSSFSYFPETLSIALTTAVVYSLLRWRRTNSRRWLAGAVGLLLLAMTVHLWEIIILLPTVFILALDREYRLAVAVSALAVVWAGMISAITDIQARGLSSLQGYYTITGGDWRLLFQWDWWTRYMPTGNGLASALTEPFALLVGITLPLCLLLAIVFAIRVATGRDHSLTILVSWLLAGASIPLLISRGYLGHVYYVWGMLAPLAIGGSVVVVRAVDQLSGYAPSLSRKRAIQAVVALLLVTATVQNVRVVASGPPLGSDAEFETAREAGIELRELNVESANDVVFVGNHSTHNVYRSTFVAKTLVYSGILVYERRYTPNDGLGPRLSETRPVTDNCAAMVYIENGSVSRC